MSYSAPFRRSLVTHWKVRVGHDKLGCLGVFATHHIGKGELVEKGVARRIEANGTTCPYLFAWGNHWAALSGCAMFYNSALRANSPNVELERDIETDTFCVRAKRDIPKDAELLRRHLVLDWLPSFAPLREVQKERRHQEPTDAYLA